MKLETAEEVRKFLVLCLKTRTITKLAKVMPGWLGDQLDPHAPHLAELKETAARLDREAERAHRAYAKALGAWIAADAEQPRPSARPCTCGYPDDEGVHHPTDGAPCYMAEGASR
ncbi:hypothetical protein [Streptomyces sp. NBC_01264]|uniref:hypothetical protein n=1 Tax=Streptomyces sp. NBC_01264 TaxID=2903804 RepID=UPI0022509CDE|nr:hypothetical protein [Streptomyces sp. NBC_01264]MCX4778135.1 hypothetical protein [Streptomyces sp. NBC_01264]